jgi:hypothetical protein
MTENIHHYLFMGGESTNDFNQQMFKLSQQPTSWVSKGMRLRRDATVFYEANEPDRLFIVSELEKVHFNFPRFYRWELQDAIHKILLNNQNRYLPDFDTYYLLIHLSLENVLKGIWLDKFPENIGFVKLPKALNTHDLICLAGDVQLELSAQQKKLLSKLAELFLGYSRYPIKNRSKQAASPRDLEFGERPYDAVCIGCLENPYARDKEVLDVLFTERLQERIELVFQHGHERMLSTFDIEEQQESIQARDSENE